MTHHSTKNSTRTGTQRGSGFHGRFYGAPIFGCKTAQVGETLRELTRVRLVLKNTLCNGAKNCAKTR